MDATGLANLDGTLRVNLINQFAPYAGDSFIIVTSQELNGGLGIELSPNLPSGLTWNVDYTPSTVVLNVEAAGLLGDFDNDVDADDIDFYSGNLGRPATGPLADLDLYNDGTVTLADHNLHVTTLVQTSNSASGTLIGNINLDGTVNVLGDAFILVSNLNSNGPNLYASENLNADQNINVLGDAFQNRAPSLCW